ncbi:MAG: hypothetical protein R3F17_04085 [Planctomycetota bacterium]
MTAIAFAPDGVGDYKGPSPTCTWVRWLDLMDADHFDQVWTSFTDGEVVDTMTIHWTRD